MPSSIACPACNSRLTLPDQLPPQVKVLRCPACKEGIPLAAAAKLKPGAPPPPRPTAPAKAKPVRTIDPLKTSPVKPVAQPSPNADDLLPGLDEGDLLGPPPDPKTPTSTLPQKTAPNLAPQEAKAPRPTSANDGFLPDLDEVGLQGDPPPAPPPTKSAPPEEFEELNLDDIEEVPVMPNLQIDEDQDLVVTVADEEEEFVTTAVADDDDLVTAVVADDEEFAEVEVVEEELDDVVEVVEEEEEYEEEKACRIHKRKKPGR